MRQAAGSGIALTVAATPDGEDRFRQPICFKQLNVGTACHAVRLRLRCARNPRPANPVISMVQVETSGTAAVNWTSLNMIQGFSFGSHAFSWKPLWGSLKTLFTGSQ